MSDTIEVKTISPCPSLMKGISVFTKRNHHHSLFFSLLPNSIPFSSLILFPCRLSQNRKICFFICFLFPFVSLLSSSDSLTRRFFRSFFFAVTAAAVKTRKSRDLLIPDLQQQVKLLSSLTASLSPPLSCLSARLDCRRVC